MYATASFTPNMYIDFSPYCVTIMWWYNIENKPKYHKRCHVQYNLKKSEFIRHFKRKLKYYIRLVTTLVYDVWFRPPRRPRHETPRCAIVSPPYDITPLSDTCFVRLITLIRHVEFVK